MPAPPEGPRARPQWDAEHREGNRNCGSATKGHGVLGTGGPHNPTPLDGTGRPRCPLGPSTELSAAVRSGTGMVLCGDGCSEALGECDPIALIAAVRTEKQ